MEDLSHHLANMARSGISLPFTTASGLNCAWLLVFKELYLKFETGSYPYTGNRNTMIMVSFDDFSAPSKSRMFIFCLFHQFTTQLYTHASNYGLI